MTTRRFIHTAIAILLGACSGGGGGGAGDDGDDGMATIDAPASKCGNGVCDLGETTTSCSADCHTTCGNNVCDAGETTATCPADCPAPHVCSPSDPASCTGETVCIAGTCENAFGRNYKIKVVSAVFTEKNAGGGTWDPLGGLPDPKATVTINAIAATTPVINNTLTPVWNFVTPPTLIPGGSVMKIEVVDADVASDDAAWSCLNNPLTANLIRAGARCSGTGPLAGAHVDVQFTPN